ncbi:hypothetical protein PIB30_016372 [Stylosanthes scabra]|uniref:Uncharacterized protein n=1 Tax=Stylosanthes scabra TaxID=79078 RepID=A0ABU6T718_9FABA|nr:hypothetical protein [Stylosanthes scabra]
MKRIRRRSRKSPPLKPEEEKEKKERVLLSARASSLCHFPTLFKSSDMFHSLVYAMPCVKQIARVVDEDPADDPNNTHSVHVSDSDSDGVADVPREYSIGFSDSVLLHWVKLSDNKAIFINHPIPKKPYLEPPSSGLLLSMDKTMKPDFNSEDCMVLDDFVEKHSFHLGHTLLQCRLKRDEFPWTSWKFEAPTQIKQKCGINGYLQYYLRTFCRGWREEADVALN